MSYRLIAFDLDGTMLDDDKKLPRENLEAMEIAAERGVYLVPATGRIIPAMPECIMELDFIRYFICSNGAYVYDRKEDRVLYKGEIEKELALKTMEYMDKLPVIYDCYRDNKAYMTRKMYNDAERFFPDQPHMLEMVKRLRRPVDELKSFVRENEGDYQKVQMFFAPEDMDLREEQLESFEKHFPRLRATSSVKNNIEINSCNAGKGKALKALAEHLGIKMEQTAAFGDGSNDCEMLSMAGCGIAMENACPELKKLADRQTLGNNRAGVGKAIKELLEQ